MSLNRPTLEKDVERKVALWAKNNGIIAIKLHGTNQKGIPDRMFGYKGRVIFIEFKRTIGGRLSLFQKTFKSKLEKSNFPVYIINNYENSIKLLKEWKGKIDAQVSSESSVNTELC